jgi:hypothetical protein
MLIKDWRAFVCIVRTWFMNGSVGRALNMGTIRAVHTDLPCTFSNCPLERGENEARDEIEYTARKVNVERLVLFFRKLHFYIGMIGVDGRVIIVLVLGWNFGCWGLEVTFEGDSLCTYSVCSRIVQRWIIRGKRVNSQLNHTLKITWPVPVSIGIFAAHPTDEFSINKMEPREGACIEVGTRSAQV